VATKGYVDGKNVSRLILYGNLMSSQGTSWTAACPAGYILVNCGMQRPGFTNFWWGASFNAGLGEAYASEDGGKCRVDVDFNGYSYSAAALCIKVQ